MPPANVTLDDRGYLVSTPAVNPTPYPFTLASPAREASARRLAEEPRTTKKARMRDRHDRLPAFPAAVLQDGRPLTPVAPATPLSPLSEPPSSPRPTQHSGRMDPEAQIEVLRTQLRAAKAEAKTYADANGELTQRALAAERESHRSADFRSLAERDAGIWKQRAEEAQQEAEKQERCAAEAERTARWAEAGQGQAERKAAEAEERTRKAEAAAKESEQRAGAEKAHREKVEKLAEAYRLVLKDNGLLVQGLRRDRVARPVAVVDDTNEGAKPDTQERSVLLIGRGAASE